MPSEFAFYFYALRYFINLEEAETGCKKTSLDLIVQNNGASEKL